MPATQRDDAGARPRASRLRARQQARCCNCTRDAGEPGQRSAASRRRRLRRCSHRRSVGCRLPPRCHDQHHVLDLRPLTELGITLPPLAIPAGAYVPFVRTGNLVFISGHIAKRDGKVWVGQLGRDMTTATGKKAARAVAIDLLGTLHAAVGDLDKVERIVSITSLVNSAPDFTEQHLVTNGCSELFGEVFADEGRARAQRLRRGADAARRLRRDRADRPGRRMTAPRSQAALAGRATAPLSRSSPSARSASSARPWCRSTCTPCSPARGACCSA